MSLRWWKGKRKSPLPTPVPMDHLQRRQLAQKFFVVRPEGLPKMKSTRLPRPDYSSTRRSCTTDYRMKAYGATLKMGWGLAFGKARHGRSSKVIRARRLFRRMSIGSECVVSFIPLPTYTQTFSRRFMLIGRPKPLSYPFTALLSLFILTP